MVEVKLFKKTTSQLFIYSLIYTLENLMQKLCNENQTTMYAAPTQLNYS